MHLMHLMNDWLPHQVTHPKLLVLCFKMVEVTFDHLDVSWMQACKNIVDMFIYLQYSYNTVTIQYSTVTVQLQYSYSTVTVGFQ